MYMYVCMLDVDQILNVNDISNTVMTKIVSNTNLRVNWLEYHMSHSSRRLKKKAILWVPLGYDPDQDQ